MLSNALPSPFARTVRRAGALLLLGMLLLASCAPQTGVQHTAVPWLVSVTTRDDTLVLQGHHFGSYAGFDSDDSYVLLGANNRGQGGERAQVLSWGGNRIVVAAPGQENARGFAFVQAGGARSNGLTVNAP